MKILILNGPNLNLLGRREKSIYGSRSFEDYLEKDLIPAFPDMELEYFQSNVEGTLIDKLHEVGFHYQGIIFNAGAYTHSSLALADAIAAIETPVIEVHISNVFAREANRHVTFIGGRAVGSISGFGLESYRLALQYFERQKPTKVGFNYTKA
ncbi:3-dehydroquinate dehydratase [Rufibacter radiotolerans]|uniref:3-dehydroquinate dehydratase n=1 Tax=Rufibacter radiotolerans TaxID=1379910 RepID=A0A0H4W750_9BACT|nr:type II 3-dehydroquinate dehydratase [Rufibacter radiotolerans]AKQ46256.1 3-dehydroquinate dehydratase [Rufibacter radiotolerans]